MNDLNDTSKAISETAKLGQKVIEFLVKLLEALYENLEELLNPGPRTSFSHIKQKNTFSDH